MSDTKETVPLFSGEISQELRLLLMRRGERALLVDSETDHASMRALLRHRLSSKSHVSVDALEEIQRLREERERKEEEEMRGAMAAMMALSIGGGFMPPCRELASQESIGRAPINHLRVSGRKRRHCISRRISKPKSKRKKARR